MKHLPMTRWIFVALAVLMPLWLLGSRLPVGLTGWMTLILMITVAPVLLILLLVQSLLFCFRRDVRQTGQVPEREARVLWLMYGAFFLCGVFLVDFGDVEGSVGSLFTGLIGGHLQVVSWILEAGFFVAGLVGYIWSIVQLVQFYRRSRQTLKPGSSPSAPAPPAG